MAVEVHRLELVAASRGMDGLIVDLRVTENQAGRTERATNSLMNSIKGLVSVGSMGFAIVGLIKAADEMKLLQARLDVATGSIERNTAAMQTAFNIAQSATAPLTTIASLYSGVSRAGKDLALTQQTVADVTNTIAQAMVVSGTGVAEAQGAITQFNQAVASGVLRGEEFNSVSEQLPRLMQAIADGFENADGSIGVMKGELRKLAEEGKLTMDKVIPAIRRGMKAVEAEAARVPLTVGGAWQRVVNAAKMYIAEADNASGSTSVLAEKLSSVSTHFDQILQTATTLAAAIGVKLVGSMVAGAVTTVSSTRASMANTAANIENLATQEQLAIAAARRAIAEKEAALVTLQRAESANAAAIADARLVQGTTAAAAADARAVAAAEALNFARMQSVAASTAAATATAAQTAATGALATAQGAATIGSRALVAATWLLTSPLGMVITLAGTAAAAWVYFGDKADEAAKKAEKASERVSQNKGSQADVDALIEARNVIDSEIKEKQRGIDAGKYFYAARAKAELRELQRRRAFKDEEIRLASDQVARDSEIDSWLAETATMETVEKIRGRTYRELLAKQDDYCTQTEKINLEIIATNEKFQQATAGLMESDQQYINALAARNKIVKALEKKKADIAKKAADQVQAEADRAKREAERITKHLQDAAEASTKAIKKADDEMADAYDRLSEMYASPISANVKMYEQRMVDIQTVGGGDDMRRKATNEFLKGVDDNLGLGRSYDVFIDQTNKAEEQYRIEQEALRRAFEDKEGMEEEYRRRTEELERKHKENLNNIDKARTQMMLQTAGGIATTLSGIAKNTVGEQSRTYKTLFGMSQAFAIADSTVQIANSIAKAANTPFPANLAAIATVASATAGIVSSIQSVKMLDTGGYVSAGDAALVGEYGPELVKGPAYVESRRNSAEKLSAAKPPTTGVIVNIINQTDVTVTKQKETVQSDGTVIIDMVVKRLASVVQQGGNQLSRSLEATYGLRRG